MEALLAGGPCLQEQLPDSMVSTLPWASWEEGREERSRRAGARPGLGAGPLQCRALVSDDPAHSRPTHRGAAS